MPWSVSRHRCEIVQQLAAEIAYTPDFHTGYLNGALLSLIADRIAVGQVGRSLSEKPEKQSAPCGAATAHGTQLARQQRIGGPRFTAVRRLTCSVPGPRCAQCCGETHTAR